MMLPKYRPIILRRQSSFVKVSKAFRFRRKMLLRRYCQEIFVLRLKHVPSTPCAKLFTTRRPLDSSPRVTGVAITWPSSLCLLRDTTRQPIPARDRARCLKWRTLHHMSMYMNIYTVLHIYYHGQDVPRISVRLNLDGAFVIGPLDPS